MKAKMILPAIMLVLGIGASAQTLNVKNGNVTYSFSSEKTGVMNFTGGSSVTIQGHEFKVADVTGMMVDNSTVADNTVTVTYNGDAANVVVAGNLANYIGVNLSGAGVTIDQAATVGDDTTGEITYILQGSSANGYFVLNGDYKASIELHGLTLTNTVGAAIDIECGKRIAMRVAEGTVNTLVDGASGSQKAALYCKGHLEFKQKGTLNVTGNKAHAISAKEYIEIKNTKINVLGSKKDGINCNQYMLVESGEITISGTADDAIQVSYKDATNREAEDTGTMTIKGGKLNLTVTAAATKAIKTDGDFEVTGGEITALAEGIGTWDSTELKTKASSCISVGGNLNIKDGTFNLTATGGGGKGFSVDGDLNISGGTYNIETSGGRLAYVNGVLNQAYTGNADNLKADYKSSPKGIKVDGKLVIDGGNFFIWTKGAGGEGMESKTTLTINGGTIVIRAYEDGTNSSSHTYINGGDITVTTGTGDAIDANGDIYVTGGRIVVVGAAKPEQGFDAGDGCAIYITGGEIMAAGGGNSAPSKSTSTQAYVILSQAVTAGAAVSISSGTEVLAEFTVPEKYSSTASAPAKGPGGGGWGFGGTGTNSLLISCPKLVNGQSYTVKIGTTSTSATARLTGGGSSI